MTQVTFSDNIPYWLICVGDDGTYGGFCMYEDNADSLFARIAGYSWKTLQSVLSSCNSAQTSVSDCVTSIKTSFVGETVQQCSVNNTSNQNGLDCMLISMFDDNQTVVAKGW